MKRNLFTALLFLCSCPLAVLAQSNEKTITVEVSNPWKQAKSDEPVVINLNAVSYTHLDVYKRQRCVHVRKYNQNYGQ